MHNTNKKKWKNKNLLYYIFMPKLSYGYMPLSPKHYLSSHGNMALESKCEWLGSVWARKPVYTCFSSYNGNRWHGRLMWFNTVCSTYSLICLNVNLYLPFTYLQVLFLACHILKGLQLVELVSGFYVTSVNILYRRPKEPSVSCVIWTAQPKLVRSGNHESKLTCNGTEVCSHILFTAEIYRQYTACQSWHSYSARQGYSINLLLLLSPQNHSHTCFSSLLFYPFFPQE